jgi:hypothetical protein
MSYISQVYAYTPPRPHARAVPEAPHWNPKKITQTPSSSAAAATSVGGGGRARLPNNRGWYGRALMGSFHAEGGAIGRRYWWYERQRDALELSPVRIKVAGRSGRAPRGSVVLIGVRWCTDEVLVVAAQAQGKEAAARRACLGGVLVSKAGCLLLAGEWRRPHCSTGGGGEDTARSG